MNIAIDSMYSTGYIIIIIFSVIQWYAVAERNVHGLFTSCAIALVVPHVVDIVCVGVIICK